MKVRESGMPDEERWVRLGLEQTAANIAGFGCGYGIFTVSAARLASGEVHAFDIEPEMLTQTRRRATAAGLSNVQYHLRDFMAEGTGPPGGKR